MKKITVLILIVAFSSFAQTGGSYQIEKSAVSSGGNASSGGNLSLESTTGQAVAGGFIQNAPYSGYIGFWIPQLAPTAANVSISGRVKTSGGQGIRNAMVSLTSQTGEIRFSQTGSFGVYNFNDVQVGETYILRVFSKRFIFTNPVLVINVNEDLTDLDFTAVEQ